MSPIYKLSETFNQVRTLRRRGGIYIIIGRLAVVPFIAVPKIRTFSCGLITLCQKVVGFVLLWTHCTLLLLTVRLAGSRQLYAGRLEIYYNGSWGTVCDDSFDDVDATVACKSLGSRLICWFCITNLRPGTPKCIILQIILLI